MEEKIRSFEEWATSNGIELSCRISINSSNILDGGLTGFLASDEDSEGISKAKRKVNRAWFYNYTLILTAY